MISGDYSTLGLLIADNNTVKTKLDTLTNQVGTGYVADSYGGLGTAAENALDLQAQVNALKTEQTTAGVVAAQQQVTQTALGQIASIASSFAASSTSLNGVDPAAVDSVAVSAKTALLQLAGLLDSTDGSLYLFAGTDTANPPIPDPANITSTGLYTQINAAVASLSSTTDNSASIIAATLAAATSDAPGTTPFSAGLAAGTASVATVKIGSADVQVGLLANANTLATSTGTATTGSYTRDLLRSLATLASLSSTQVNDPGFSALVSSARSGLQSAVTALATETGALGNIQSSLTAQATAAGDTSTALQTQLSSVQDVDTATALSNLSEVQTQLQASYRLISGALNLSLVNYLPN